MLLCLSPLCHCALSPSAYPKKKPEGKKDKKTKSPDEGKKNPRGKMAGIAFHQKSS
jgi:hypothetical protein